MTFIAEAFKRVWRKPKKAFAIEELSPEERRAIAEAKVPDEIEYMDGDDK